MQEKIGAGYYPQADGQQKPLSRRHRQHPEPEKRQKWGYVAARTRPEREGTEKTQPDVDAMQRQIQELLDEKARTLEKLADRDLRITKLRDEVSGLRRTVGGAGFSLTRLKQDLDNRRRANEELEARNHSLRKELRRAGQRLLDLGK